VQIDLRRRHARVPRATHERERMNLGLPRTSKATLLDEAHTFPRDTGFRDRDWLGLDVGSKRWPRRVWMRIRNRFAKPRSVNVWMTVLATLTFFDAVVFFDALIDWVCEWRN
jgi:hypothetical protein